jgi:hypothetical protein
LRAEDRSARQAALTTSQRCTRRPAGDEAESASEWAHHPAIRQELRESTQSERELARADHLNRAMVRQGRRRDNGADAAHRLYTTLTPAQELVVVELRTTLLLSVDDLLAVTREFLNPEVSRSGLDRCLSRQGVSHLQTPLPQPDDAEQPWKSLKDDEPGFVHVGVK